MKLSVFAVAFYSLRKILSFKKSKRELESFWYSYMTGYRQKLCGDSKAWYETTKGKKMVFITLLPFYIMPKAVF